MQVKELNKYSLITIPVKEMKRCFTFQTLVAKWVYISLKIKIGFLLTACTETQYNKSKASAFMDVKNWIFYQLTKLN